MSFRLAAAAALGVLMVMPTAASAQVLMQRDVSLRMALAIAEAALAECGDRTSVAVVDRAGRLRVFLQGDNANPQTWQVLKISPTGEISLFVQGPPLKWPNGIALDSQGNIVVVNTGDSAVLTFSPAGQLQKTEFAAQAGDHVPSTIPDRNEAD